MLLDQNEDAALSQEEIDSLLNAFLRGEIQVEPEPDDDMQEGPVAAKKSKSIDRIDLFRLPSSRAWKVPNFDIVLETFARNYSLTLTNKFQRATFIKLEDIQSTELDTLLQKIGKEHNAIGVLNIKPLKSNSLLIFDRNLAFTTVEVVLGGATEGKVTTLKRPLTSIETDLVGDTIQDSCTDLVKAFKPLEDITASLVKVETNIRMANIASHDTGVLVAQFSVKIDNIAGKMLFMMPYASLEPLREKLREGFVSLAAVEEQTWQPALQQKLQRLPIELKARFKPVELQAEQIMALKKGDILELGRANDLETHLFVGEKPAFIGKYGASNDNKAVNITSFVKQDT